MITKAQALGLVNDKRIRAFLDVIARAEGSGYRTLVNKGSNNTAITDLSRHPNINIKGSTAAGRYQFLYRTWQGVASAYGLTDFSPLSQDLGAIRLIDEKGAIGDILSGNIASAIHKVGSIWASFPNNSYGQNPKNANTLLSWYNTAYGSVVSAVSTVENAVTSSDYTIYAVCIGIILLIKKL